MGFADLKLMPPTWRQRIAEIRGIRGAEPTKSGVVDGITGGSGTLQGPQEASKSPAGVPFHRLARPHRPQSGCLAPLIRRPGGTTRLLRPWSVGQWLRRWKHFRTRTSNLPVDSREMTAGRKTHTTVSHDSTFEPEQDPGPGSLENYKVGKHLVYSTCQAAQQLLGPC